jgi:polysaccharide export outer membrane protein
MNNQTRTTDVLCWALRVSRLLLELWAMQTCLTLSLTAQAPTPEEARKTDNPQLGAAAAQTTVRDDYLIGEDDLLNVYILDVPELSREYRVSSTGRVEIPLLKDPLLAAGMTLSQFSEELSKELKSAGLVSDPHVNTSVNQSRLHAVAITGAVKRPQIYALLSETTLLDILSQAEGLADDAGNAAIVSRGDIGMHALSLKNKASTQGPAETTRTTSVDLKRLFESGDAGLNIAIYPGDRVTIPRAGVIYVVGAVNKPGGFTMRASSHGMTVLQAVALAENAKTTAHQDQTMIIRNDSRAPEGRKQIPINLKKILQGKAPDPTLEAEDILFVPDSSGKRALHRGIEGILQVTTGAAIYSTRF